MMVGIWQYPVNPAKDIPHYGDPNQFRMSGSEIRKYAERENLRYTDVNVPEDIALRLAKRSPNPSKAENAVFLLAAQNQLKLMPLAALLFASARR